MKFAFYTNSISPHQMPLARELVKVLGEENYRYIYRDDPTEVRRKLGWGTVSVDWMSKGTWKDAALLHADVVMCGLRAIELFERRNAENKRTLYCAERWFKPLKFWLPGILRLLHPGYWRMARRFVKCAEDKNFWLFPMGVHAARDMARLFGIMHGDWRCWFRAPELAFEKVPGGLVRLARGGSSGEEEQYGLLRMRLWGYFVAKSEKPVKLDALPVEQPSDTHCGCKVLWVGRLLDWKRVDTIVRAVGANADLKRVDTWAHLRNSPHISPLSGAGNLNMPLFPAAPGL